MFFSFCIILYCTLYCSRYHAFIAWYYQHPPEEASAEPGGSVVDRLLTDTTNDNSSDSVNFMEEGVLPTPPHSTISSNSDKKSTEVIDASHIPDTVTTSITAVNTMIGDNIENVRTTTMDVTNITTTGTTTSTTTAATNAYRYPKESSNQQNITTPTTCHSNVMIV